MLFDEGEGFDEEELDIRQASEQSLLALLALQAYLAFAVNMHAITKKYLFVEKKGKEDMVLAHVQACSQMEDRRN
jgi:hypothetical protein